MSLFIRNLLFTILQPGVVAGLIPYWIVKDKGIDFHSISPSVNHYLGLLIFLTGLLGLFACIFMFASVGKGTLSPLDPTRHLVITGLYRYSRNPMYISVMIMLMGECIYCQSSGLLIYSIITWTAFNLFIILHEEPRLKRVFGEEYEAYRRRVRRWI